MILNKLLDISNYLGINEKDVRKLLMDGTIPCVINGINRKFYYTTDYLLDFACERLNNRRNEEHKSYKHTLINKNNDELFEIKHKKTHVTMIGNQKGGVGKTTNAIHIAAAAALLGKKTKTRVLIVDADSQANTSTYFDDELKNGNSLNNLIKRIQFDGVVSKEEVEKAIFTVDDDGVIFDILPSELRVGKTFGQCYNLDDKYQVLEKILAPIKEDYDLIILDTPPSADIINANAVNVSDSVLFSSTAHAKAVDGMAIMIEEIEDYNMQNEREVRLDGVIVTRFMSKREKEKDKIEDMYELMEESGQSKDMLSTVREDIIFGMIEDCNKTLISYKKNLNSSMQLMEPSFKYAAKILLEIDKG